MAPSKNSSEEKTTLKHKENITSRSRSSKEKKSNPSTSNSKNFRQKPAEKLNLVDSDTVAQSIDLRSEDKTLLPSKDSCENKKDKNSELMIPKSDLTFLKQPEVQSTEIPRYFTRSKRKVSYLPEEDNERLHKIVKAMMAIYLNDCVENTSDDTAINALEAKSIKVPNSYLDVICDSEYSKGWQEATKKNSDHLKQMRHGKKLWHLLMLIWFR
ncbi:hypothetical protein EPUL_001840 [Erysiphe pulchra]|uniref:Uncharacterized protein n=1 Tax=Erysiphe pulchra TaxID=225359 RepID=A0A2S4PTN9_9PEZI|nr:hypothetical protein EPUL_001840 [Erysiphe pulchra]